MLATISASIKAFYQGQIDALNKAALKTTVACAADGKLDDALPDETDFVPVNFSRVLSPFKDIKTLWKLYRFFANKRFDIIQYSTPKASLLGAIAAFAARAPVRIYILWGLYYTGQSGVKRFVFKLFEKLICRLSTHIIPISHEMINFALSEGLGKRSKYEVMFNGSACGVDLERFEPKKWESFRNKIRNEINIPEHATVVGTVSRLTGDKGINELAEAFDTISSEIPLLYLLLVGDQEEKDRLLPSTEQIIRSNTRIKTVGWQANPLPYYAAMDIFCLPTYREGFGKVNLEAQAMGLPVISTNVIGPRESVQNNVTGFLVEPKNSEALIGPLKKLVLDKELRIKMGKAGRERIKRMFDSKDVIKAIVEHRLKLLSSSTST
ncbi:MAG: glycosyltransferase family 4 protein [Planctomycetota bacterium]